MRPALSSLLCTGALLGGCAAPIEAGEVRALLDAQAAAWNRGDLEAFVAAYRDRGELTFLGADGLLRGGEDLLRRYRAAYPTAAERGRLSFRILEVRPVGAAAALVLGAYELEREAPARGYFTLVVERAGAGLAIVHDHTTAEGPR